MPDTSIISCAAAAACSLSSIIKLTVLSVFIHYITVCAALKVFSLKYLTFFVGNDIINKNALTKKSRKSVLLQRAPATAESGSTQSLFRSSLPSSAAEKTVGGDGWHRYSRESVCSLSENYGWYRGDFNASSCYCGTEFIFLHGGIFMKEKLKTIKAAAQNALAAADSENIIEELRVKYL